MEKKFNILVVIIGLFFVVITIETIYTRGFLRLFDLVQVRSAYYSLIIMGPLGAVLVFFGIRNLIRKEY